MLVTFEGIDGSGKSTQAQRLAERLEEEGYPVLLVREPGGTPLSERVRALLLDADLQVGPLAELLLFSAARAQLVAERIRPALQDGTVVVCDRFYDSTLAYQGAGRELDDRNWLRALNERATGALVPDRTYLVDVPLEVTLRRAGTAGPQDRMEAGPRAFYERVTAAYARLADEEADRIVRLDGTASIEVIHARIWDDVKRRLAPKNGTTVRSGGSSD